MNESNVMEQEVQTEDNNVVVLPAAQQSEQKTSKKEIAVGVLGIIGILGLIAQAIIWCVKGAKKLFKKFFGKKKEEKPAENDSTSEIDPDDIIEVIEDDESEEK